MAHWIANGGGGVNSSPTDPSLPSSSGTSSGTFTRAIGDGPWPIGGDFNEARRYYAKWKDGDKIRSDKGSEFIYNFETNENKKVFEAVYKGTVLKNEFKVTMTVYPPVKYYSDNDETVYDNWYEAPENISRYMKDYSYKTITPISPNGSPVSMPNYSEAGGYIAITIMTINSGNLAYQVYGRGTYSENNRLLYKDISSAIHEFLPPIKDKRTGKIHLYDIETSDYYYDKIGLLKSNDSVIQYRRPLWTKCGGESILNYNGNISYNLYDGRRSWVNNMSYINTVEMYNDNLTELPFTSWGFPSKDFVLRTVENSLEGFWEKVSLRTPSATEFYKKAPWPMYWCLDGGLDNGTYVLHNLATSTGWDPVEPIKAGPSVHNYYPYAGYNNSPHPSYFDWAYELNITLYAPISRGVLETLFESGRLYLKHVSLVDSPSQFTFYPDFGYNSKGEWIKYE